MNPDKIEIEKCSNSQCDSITFHDEMLTRGHFEHSNGNKYQLRRINGYTEIWNCGDLEFTVNRDVTDYSTLEMLIDVFELGLEYGRRNGINESQSNIRRVLGIK